MKQQQSVPTTHPVRFRNIKILPIVCKKKKLKKFTFTKFHIYNAISKIYNNLIYLFEQFENNIHPKPKLNIRIGNKEFLAEKMIKLGGAVCERFSFSSEEYHIERIITQIETATKDGNMHYQNNCIEYNGYLLK